MIRRVTTPLLVLRECQLLPCYSSLACWRPAIITARTVLVVIRVGCWLLRSPRCPPPCRPNFNSQGVTKCLSASSGLEKDW